MCVFCVASQSPRGFIFCVDIQSWSVNFLFILLLRVSFTCAVSVVLFRSRKPWPGWGNTSPRRGRSRTVHREKASSTKLELCMPTGDTISPRLPHSCSSCPSLMWTWQLAAPSRKWAYLMLRKVSQCAVQKKLEWARLAGKWVLLGAFHTISLEMCLSQVVILVMFLILCMYLALRSCWERTLNMFSPWIHAFNANPEGSSSSRWVCPLASVCFLLKKKCLVYVHS